MVTETALAVNKVRVTVFAALVELIIPTKLALVAPTNAITEPRADAIFAKFVLLKMGTVNVAVPPPIALVAVHDP
jgi:hypothetical protein